MTGKAPLGNRARWKGEVEDWRERPAEAAEKGRNAAMQCGGIAGQRGIVWLASYPKSGNTWMRALLANFLRGSHQPVPLDLLPGKHAADGGRFDELAGVAAEDCTGDEIDSLTPAFLRLRAAEPQGTESRLYKVHSAYVANRNGQPLFPKDITAGAVYLVRNPLDVAVSWAFHAHEGDFSRSVACLNDDALTIGGGGDQQYRQRVMDWSSNVRSWCAAPFPVLVVRYEDLLADAAAALRRVVRFLGLEGGSDARVLRAAGCSEFAKLRENETATGFRENRAESTSLFFREGRAGGWCRFLSAAQVHSLVDMHRSTMAAFGYDPADALRAVHCDARRAGMAGRRCAVALD